MVGVLLFREHVIRAVRAVGPAGLLTGGKDTGVIVRVTFQDTGHEIVHGCGFVDPGGHDSLVAFAGGVAADLRQKLFAVYSDAGLFGFGAVDGAVPVAGVLHHGILLNDTEFQTLLGGVGGCTHAAVSGSHDEDVRIPCFGDGGVVNIGFGSQPVVRASFVDGDDVHNGLSSRLGKAFAGCHDDGLGGDGRAAYPVDLRALGGQKGFPQRVPCILAVAWCFTGHVKDHVRNIFFVKSHGDGDGAVDAVGSACVGAGDVFSASGSGSCFGGGRGSGRSGLGCCAGGGSFFRGASGYGADGGNAYDAGHTFQEITAG